MQEKKKRFDPLEMAELCENIGAISVLLILGSLVCWIVASAFNHRIFDIAGGVVCTMAMVALVASWIMDRFWGIDWPDRGLMEKSRDGQVVLLTCDQYLSLHTAAPEKYPLTEDGIAALSPWQSTDGQYVKMVKEEWKRLNAIITDNKNKEKAAKAERACLATLKEMQADLAEYIEKQEAANVEAAKDVAEKTVQLVEAELTAAAGSGGL